MPVTSPSSTQNQQLIAAFETSESETLIESAFAALGRELDPALLVSTIKALVRAGLAGLAIRLLDCVGGASSLSALREQLVALPRGEMPREALRSRLRAHIETLKKIRPQVANTLRTDDIDFERFTFMTSRRGNIHVLRNRDAQLDFVFTFQDHVERTRCLRLPEVTPTTSFVLIGAPSLPLFTTLLQTRGTDGYAPPIDVIEPDSEVFAIWLAMMSDPNVWMGERVSLFVGEEASAQHRRFLIEHRHRAPSAVVIANSRPRWRAPALDADLFEAAHAAQQERWAATKRGLQQRFAKMDARAWRERFAMAGRTTPPLRVLGLTSRFSTVLQFAMRDLGAAFERAGCRFEMVKQPHDSAATVDLPGALMAETYDLIFVIDHLRFEFADILPNNVPFVGWIQDHMKQLCDRQAGRSIGDFDVVVGHSPHVMASLYDYPADRFLASNNLTDASTYDATPLSEEELAPFRCDVSYVSHGAAPAERLVDDAAGGSPALRAYLTRFLELAKDRLQSCACITNHELVELMLRAENESGHPPLPSALRRQAIYPAVASIYDRLYRHQTLEWTAEWARARQREFRIYGKGWEHNPQFAAFARGEVQSGDQLRRLYQASAVSLQVNGYSSLHQRLLDGLAAGGFMIARYNAADFVCHPYRQIQATIRERRLRTFDDVAALRLSDRAFDAICLAAEELSSAVIATADNPRRQAHIQTIREGNPIPELCDDEGLFAVLSDMRYFPSRTAADLPGFEHVVFRNKHELHSLLDRHVDNIAERRRIVEKMRDSVIRHDTYDGLIARILATFDEHWRRVIAGEQG